MITGSRIWQPAGGRKRARTHERKDEKWPCWPLDLWTEEGRQNKSAGTVRGRKLIPPRCCASVDRGVPDQPTGTADIKPPPHSSVWSPFKRLSEWWGVGGLQVAVETLGTKSTRTQAGTMDTNPEILMPMVVAHWGWRQGCVGVYLRCSDRLPTHPCCWPRRLLSKDIRSLPILLFSLPPLLLLCMHISHSHGITHSVSPGQHIHTKRDAHHFATPVEHGCQAEKGREMYSFTFYCARIEC